MKRLSTISFLISFAIVSFILIAYARGFRVDLTKKKITSTGLLVATSVPDGASVILNGHLTTATNSTTNLPPGDYDVRIAKEGYLPWNKKLKVQPEIVTKTDALLFPAAPSLTPLTLSGALSPSLSPDGSQIVFVTTPHGSTAPNLPTNGAGLWVFPMLTRPLSFTRDAQRIAKSTISLDFSQAKTIWSADSKQIIALFLNDNKKPITSDNISSAYLLDAGSNNPAPQDITATLSLTLNDWQTKTQAKYLDQLLSLPKGFLKIATTSATLLKFAPDESKILYEATASATIPQIIKPPLIGANTQLEERNIIPNSVYVYDIKEDKNFKITEIKTFPSLFWFPDSKHLVSVQKQAISIMEYDATNNVTVFSGPFEDSFVFPWPDGSKLVVLTTLNKTAGDIPNLYAVGLK